jgi:Bacteriophage HK97-gp10, putative tail-component
MRIRVNIRNQTKHIAPELKGKAQRLLNEVALYGVGQAIRNAPRKTGHLQRSIHILRKGAGRITYGTALVYARIQEFGGVIRPKRAKYLSWVENGRRVFAKQVRIKGKFYLTRSARSAQRAVSQIAKRVFGR